VKECCGEEKCGGEALYRSVVGKRCEGVSWRRLVVKCFREVFWESVVGKCCEGVLWRRLVVKWFREVFWEVL